jgi:hypothetical protein
VPSDYTPPPLNGKRLRWTKDMHFGDKPTRVEEAATKKLRKEIEAQDKEKQAARFAALSKLPRKSKRKSKKGKRK